MKRIIPLIIFIYFGLGAIAQDCFYPESGDTLYTTTSPLYGDTAISGFITLGSNFSGSWDSVSTTGSAKIKFSDNSGRTSTFQIWGEGEINIENQVTQLAPVMVLPSCTQNFKVVNYTSNNSPNPPITGPCPLNLVVVLDESSSIEANMSTQIVRDAVMALANGLMADPSDHKMAVVEFATLAENVSLGGSTALQSVDASFVANLNSYLTMDYTPPPPNPTLLIGGTNWEDAMRKADLVAGANLILFLTDGRPTFYSVNGFPLGVAGEGLEFDLTALKQAQDAANIVKSKNKHLFVLGIDFPTDNQPLVDISGPVEYLMGQPASTMLSSDFSLVPPGQLVDALTTAGQFCAPPAEPIPTLSQWAIINLFLLLMIIGVVGIKENSYQESKS